MLGRYSLNGYVVADDDAEAYRWYGLRVCCPADVRKAIETTPEGETLTIEVNSCGGSVFAGYEIYSVLKAAKCKTVAEIQSLSASAASTAMLGCSTVHCSPVAQVMIHLPSIGFDGNQLDLVRANQTLESITEGILNAYEQKCKSKTSREDLRTMMENETWLSAQVALDAGLIDGILYQNGAQDYVNSLAGLPNVAVIRQAYKEHKAKPDETQRLRDLIDIESAMY